MRKIDDIIALIALSTRADGLIGDYIKRKRGLMKSDLTPLLEEICAKLWRHDLPGAGDGCGEQTRRLLTRARRSSPARHGQKGQREDGEGEKEFHRGLCAH
jgi:hypothetical protein